MRRVGKKSGASQEGEDAPNVLFLALFITTTVINVKGELENSVPATKKSFPHPSKCLTIPRTLIYTCVFVMPEDRGGKKSLQFTGP